MSLVVNNQDAGGAAHAGVKVKHTKLRSISVRGGTARINLNTTGRVTLAGPTYMDHQRLRLYCVDGLREVIKDLNHHMDLCIEAAEQMKQQWPECDVIGGLIQGEPSHD